jgi:hypothetical protein
MRNWCSSPPDLEVSGGISLTPPTKLDYVLVTLVTTIDLVYPVARPDLLQGRHDPCEIGHVVDIGSPAFWRIDMQDLEATSPKSFALEYSVSAVDTDVELFQLRRLAEQGLEIGGADEEIENGQSLQIGQLDLLGEMV